MGKKLDRNHRRNPNVQPVAYRNGPPPRAVVDPDGVLWPSLSQAGTAYGLSAPTVRRRARLCLGGWHFPEGA
jgi:hypothetical protein